MTSPILKVENAYINLKYVTDVKTKQYIIPNAYSIYLIHGGYYSIPEDILPVDEFIKQWELYLNNA